MSMVTLGNAVWNVVADSTGLQQGLDQSRQSIEKTGGFFARNSRKIGLAVSAAGATITGVMAKATSDFATGAHEIGILQEHTGFAAESLGQMVRVFENAGLGAADLRRAAYNVRREIASMKDATDESTTSLGQLGLSYEQLEQLSPEQQFLAVVDAMEGVDDANTRASLANDIFRGKAEQMLLVMGDTEGAFRAAAEAQRALYTQEDIDNAAAYDDATNDLNNALADLWATLGRELLPEIIRLKEWITTVVEDVRDWIEENPQLTSTIIRVTSVLGGLMVVLGPMLVMLPGIVTAVGLVGGALAALAGPVGIAIAVIGGLVAAGVWLYKNWDDLTSGIAELWEWLGETLGRIAGTLVQAITNPLDTLKAVWENTWKAMAAIIMGTWESIKRVLGWIIDGVGWVTNLLSGFTSSFSQGFHGAVSIDGAPPQAQGMPGGGQGLGSTVNIDARGAYIRDEADMDRMARDIGDYTAAQLAGAGA